MGLIFLWCMCTIEKSRDILHGCRQIVKLHIYIYIYSIWFPIFKTKPNGPKKSTRKLGGVSTLHQKSKLVSMNNPGLCKSVSKKWLPIFVSCNYYCEYLLCVIIDPKDNQENLWAIRGSITNCQWRNRKP